MEPLGKLNAHFPTVTEHINKRNKKVRNPIPVRPTNTPSRPILFPFLFPPFWLPNRRQSPSNVYFRPLLTRVRAPGAYRRFILVARLRLRPQQAKQNARQTG